MLVEGLHQCSLLCHVMFEFHYECTKKWIFSIDKAMKGFFNLVLKRNF